LGKVRSEHIHGGYPCTGGYVHIRREVEETLSYLGYTVHGEYPFAGGDVQSAMILDE
jgi:hypothetical protein